MLTQTKKYSIIKKGFKAFVFSACKKTVAFFCVAGLVMITNIPLVSAYEAHTVNVTARIVNDIPDINPPGGEFCVTGEFKVELSVSLADADIYYTTNGDDPVCGVNIYTEPFELPGGITLVKAVACHEELRNGQLITLRSAVMAKEFDGSAPIVNVTEPKNGDIWYCNPSDPNIYSIEWMVDDYRGAASELDIDIVYIIDTGTDENGGVTGEIDGEDKDTYFYNLPGTAGLTGEDTSYQFELIQEYCYYGHGWMKVIITEPNGCGGFGVSGKIFDPMVCDSPGISVSSAAPVTPESEPVIENDNSNDIPDNADNTSDDNLSDNDDLYSEDTNEDNVSKEVEEDNGSEDIRNEDSEGDVDDLDLLSEDEDDSISNEEEENQEDEIIIDREEDDEEESDDDDIEEDDTINDNSDNIEDDEESDGDGISDDLDDENIGNGSDNDNNGETDDGVSIDELPITPDDDSTIIEISI